MRIRTAKQLGTRHDRNYFKAWTPLRRWRLLLSVTLPVLGLGWLLFYSVRGDAAPYSSGPLSPPHNVFGKNCSVCHAQEKPLFGTVKFHKKTAPEACLKCHSAPQHQAAETFTPECASCHMEHRGIPVLSEVSDQVCTQCHQDLRVRSGQPRFEKAVLRFRDSHPEFAPLRKASDAGTIALNHYVHLKAGLLGPRGPVQMECADCHRAAADAAGPWRFAAMGAALAAEQHPASPNAATGAAMAATASEVPSAGRAYMAPISFANQCAACHVLHFDERIDAAAPHDRPEVVREFVAHALEDYLKANPDAWRQPTAPLRRIIGAQPVRPASSPQLWLQERIADAETLLWRKTCKQCHTLETVAGSDLPRIKPAAIATRWLPNAHFSHFSHQALRCDSCHQQALASTKTSDVLLPGIAKCRTCHAGDPKQIGLAEDRCFLCHTYHDWKQHVPPARGEYTINQFPTGGPK